MFGIKDLGRALDILERARFVVSFACTFPGPWRRRKRVVVAPSQWQVYDFARVNGFQAVFDRRRSERRQDPMRLPRDINRRVRDRRVRDISEDLRRFGWAMIDT
jgi:hypothetical protein